jgi:hypothetical protein
VIDAGARVLNDLSGQDAPLQRECLSEVDFVNFVSSVRVRVGAPSVWLFTEKMINLGAEVVEMLLRPSEAEFGTVESIWTKGRHVTEIRSNERPRVPKGGASFPDGTTMQYLDCSLCYRTSSELVIEGHPQ